MLQNCCRFPGQCTGLDKIEQLKGGQQCALCPGAAASENSDRRSCLIDRICWFLASHIDRSMQYPGAGVPAQPPFGFAPMPGVMPPQYAGHPPPGMPRWLSPSARAAADVQSVAGFAMAGPPMGYAPPHAGMPMVPMMQVPVMQAPVMQAPVAPVPTPPPNRTRFLRFARVVVQVLLLLACRA